MSREHWNLSEMTGGGIRFLTMSIDDFLEALHRPRMYVCKFYGSDDWEARLTGQGPPPYWNWYGWENGWGAHPPGGMESPPDYAEMRETSPDEMRSLFAQVEGVSLERVNVLLVSEDRLGYLNSIGVTDQLLSEAGFHRRSN